MGFEEQKSLLLTRSSRSFTKCTVNRPVNGRAVHQQRSALLSLGYGPVVSGGSRLFLCSVGEQHHFQRLNRRTGSFIWRNTIIRPTSANTMISPPRIASVLGRSPYPIATQMGLNRGSSIVIREVSVAVVRFSP